MGNPHKRHGPALAEQAEAYRLDYNTVRPHEAIAWNRPHAVHLGLADPTIPNFPQPEPCQLLDAGHWHLLRPRTPVLAGARTTPPGQRSRPLPQPSATPAPSDGESGICAPPGSPRVLTR